MVALTDLPEVNRLYAEARAIDQGIRNFDAGGLITELTVSGEETGMEVSVPTRGITYPAEMVAAIKTGLTARRRAVDARLAELGVSGVEPPPAQPQQARRPR